VCLLGRTSFFMARPPQCDFQIYCGRGAGRGRERAPPPLPDLETVYFFAKKMKEP